MTGRADMLVRYLSTAARMCLVTMVVLGLAYPLAVTALAWPFELSSGRASGSLVRAGGSVVGSELIGQRFESARYFHGRPSGAGAGYDALASGSSDLAPTSRKLVDEVRARVGSLRRQGVRSAGRGMPVDLVTESGSGLDPHITPASAYAQCERVARGRGVSVARVRRLVDSHVEGPQLGLLGERRVNVLLLNISLDEAFGGGLP